MTPRIGIDFVDIDEVAATLARFGDRYLRRVFAPSEIAACAAGTDSRRLSGCFAAKEATLKALSVGEEEEVDWCSIEVCGLPSGRLELALSGKTAEIAARAGVYGVAVSISTTRRYAAAIVILSTRLRSDST